jgi:polar amino acid transport system substrate-binding protein
MPAMTTSGGCRGILCVAIVIVGTLSGRASLAESLRLVVDFLPPYEQLRDDKAPGFSVEVLRQVFAVMGQDVSFENFPWNRNWMMIARGDADGIFSVQRTGEREQICSFPDEPLTRARRVLFVRTADIGKLKFSSFDDLVGHDVAVHEAAPGLFKQPTLPPELWQFLREHHNIVETQGTGTNFRMLAAGRVDYAVADLANGMRVIADTKLSGRIEPLLSRSVMEDGHYICFTKGRVSPEFVDSFSRALKQFKQTEAFQALYRKYFP